MAFDFKYNDKGITLKVHQETPGFLKSLFSRPKGMNLDQLSTKDRNLLFAIADLKRVAENHVDGLYTDDTSIWMNHSVAADLDTQTATALGLPPIVDLTFKTDVDGVPGQNQFRLRHEWLRLGEKQIVTRIGCILKTSDGLRRLPKWLLDAIKVSEAFKTGSDLQTHWEALARFRQSLEPRFHQEAATTNAQMGMSDFLRRLHVQIADGFSITPTGSDIDPEFEVVPFSRKALEEENEEAEEGEVSVTMAELAGRPLKEFQKRVRDKGTLSAYRVAAGRFLVIDRSAAPALKVMAEMHSAPREERAAFIKNPRQKITAAVEQDLRDRGVLKGLSDAEQEEMIERVAFPTFVETKEYSARVTGKTIYTGPSMIVTEGSAAPLGYPRSSGKVWHALSKGCPWKNWRSSRRRSSKRLARGTKALNMMAST